MILNALNDLLLKKENDHELQVNIGTFIREIENYLKSEKKDMEYAKYIEKQKEELFLTQKQINNYRDEFNQKFDNIEKKYNNLSQENNALKAKCNNLDTQVAQLKEKVEFMEPIVLSLICRKVLNYSIIKILEKYKRNIKVTVKINTNGETNYDIRFCSPVNNIDIVTLNIWLNNLFFRKDGFNSNSHLVNKDLPSFIPNIWEKVKESLNLDLGGAVIFDSLITEDIKSGFNFRADDVSINSYLKSVNINEFGN